MKKNILAFAVLSLILVSCDNVSGGNKNIIPEDPAGTQTEAHADHSAHAEAQKPADAAKTEDKTATQAEAKKVDSVATKTEAKKEH